MRAFELFPHRHVQRFRRDALRFASVGMTIIALVISECLPITATVRRPRTATPYMVADLPSPIAATASLGRLAGEAINQWPLRFEACDKGVSERFLARTSNCNIHLTATEATLVWQTTAGAGRLGRGADLGLPRNAGSLDANEQLPGPRRDRAAPRPRRSATDESLTASVRMQLMGANPRAEMVGEGALATPTNYFIGDDPKRWRTNVPGYLRVKAANVYRGVDVIYYGKGRQFEYDFKVAPGADPAVIRLRFAGARRVTLDQAGDLIIETTAGRIRHCKPIAYQEVNGSRQTIASGFVLQGRYDVGFALGHYDGNLPLVIDPVLNFASLLQDSAATGVAVDAAGNIYLTGSVFSSCLPTTPGVVQPSFASGSCLNCTDVFITKLDPTGTMLIYSTYLGGADQDVAAGIAVDAAGNAYVTGQTRSNNFPVTPGAFQTVLKMPGFGQGDAFVTKLNPTGTALIYSTYLGGRDDDQATTVAADASGNAYVAGYTTSMDFPLLNPFQGRFIGGNCIGSDVVFLCTDAFLTKLNAAGALAYSTFIGGNGEDRITALAADGAGNVYATGATASRDFPVTAGAFQTAYRGDSSFGDAFVLKLNAAGSALVYSTYLGGSGTDSAHGIAVDAGGSVYITGDTSSTDFPITPQAVQPRNASRSFFTSTNGGSNWSADSAGLPSIVTIQGFAIAPTMPATLYAGTNLGLYKSTDGGHSWRTLAFFVSYIRLLALDPKNPATLYVVISDPFGDFLYKSTDGGMGWGRLSFYTDDFGFLISSLVIDPQNPSILYVVTNGINRPGDFPIVLKSTDGGHSWQGASKGLPVVPEGVTTLAIDPNHPATLYASARGAYRTVNGGRRWTPITSLSSFHSLVVSPADSNVAYAATNSGVFKSVNGGTTWKRLKGLPAFSFSNVQLDPATPSTVYVTAGGIFKSTDSGTSWAAINAGFSPGQRYLLGIDRQNPATLYAQGGGGGKEGFVTRLNADGSGLIFSTYLGGSSDEFVNAIGLDPSGNVYVAGSSLARDFPIREALQNSRHERIGSYEAFATKLSGDGSTLVYSTYLGGAATRALAVDAAGSAYVVGDTSQGTALIANVLPQRFGTCAPFFQRDGFILKIADAFSGLPAPVVQAISPTQAPSMGGTEITISGNNFMPGAAVRIAGVLANHVRVLNSTTIKAVTAPSARRFVSLDVAVINPDGQSNSLVEAFTYLLTPIITRVEISGRDLIVFGIEFDIDATILLNGEPQNTILRIIGTERTLIGKKLGKRIKPGETVTLQVQHDNGIISAPFVFTRPPQ